MLTRHIQVFFKKVPVGRLFYTMSATNIQPFTVFVEGNIGSGKTTFLEHFRQFEDITLLTEPVKEWRDLRGWNLLDLMYKDPSRWAMTFQSYVALTMLDMHRQPTATPVKLMERSVYSARHCFVEHMMRSGVMHPAEFAVLDEWFCFIQQHLPIQADLIVYLKTTPSVVYERIKKRARSEEQCIPLSYIEELHKIHEDWLVHRIHGNCPAPVLVLDADLDLTQITEEYKKSEHQILRKAVDVVMRSPNKLSPKKPITSSPIKIVPQLRL
ncbi:deoxynucleoside kinase-like isoform X2 [Hyposmocoma kahamanoa]|uniref:deoxynucleoside kinase-like isoform X2 n=1 Tax=Hyposmocoma kahamanoa TaxID=1477025 RepID=UPI000E6D60A3|nr:deoxynucleoside kinase-like isoform X2 [Hyposmocoma kahamanoa]